MKLVTIGRQKGGVEVFHIRDRLRSALGEELQLRRAVAEIGRGRSWFQGNDAPASYGGLRGESIYFKLS